MSRSIKKNLAYNISYQIITVILPLVTSPYIARVLGAEVTGIYSYTYSVANYFVIAACLGISTYAQRTVAKVQNNKYELSKVFWNIYTFQVLTSFISILAYWGYVLSSKNNTKIASLQLLYVISNLFDITWFFFGIEEFKVTVIRNTAIKLVCFIGILSFIKTKNDLPFYTIIMAGSVLLGQLSVWPFLRKRIIYIRPTLKGILPHIKPSLILFIPALAISIFTIMDKVMLGCFSTMEQVGFYENTSKVIDIPKGFIRALGTVMLPRISNLVANKKFIESGKYFEQTMIFIFCAGSAFTFGIAGISDIFANVFWGKDFSSCGVLLSGLTPALMFSAIGNVIRTQYLIPNEKDFDYTFSLILGAVVNVSLNYLLIPDFGAVGAVIGTVGAEASLCLYQIWTIRKVFHIHKGLNNSYPFLLIGIVMYIELKAMVSVLPYNVPTLLLCIAIGGCTYLGATFLYLKKSRKSGIIQFRISILKIMHKGWHS